MAQNNATVRKQHGSATIVTLSEAKERSGNPDVAVTSRRRPLGNTKGAVYCPVEDLPSHETASA